jgi:hypothetical protein
MFIQHSRNQWFSGLSHYFSYLNEFRENTPGQGAKMSLEANAFVPGIRRSAAHQPGQSETDAIADGARVGQGVTPVASCSAPASPKPIP